MLLGEVVIDVAVLPEPGGQGSRSVPVARPRNTPLDSGADTPLDSGEPWWHWLLPGETYRIEHGAAGWRVSCDSWVIGRIYRLAERDGRPAGHLPLAAGSVELRPGIRYELREAAPGRWVLSEVEPE